MAQWAKSTAGRAVIVLAAVLLFALLATLNAGGYRYGASDQAFYIPAIRHHLDPGLFPRDWPMLGSQDQLNAFTAILALAVRVTGLPLPVLFFLTYLVSLAVLAGALIILGRSLYRSWWTVGALACAMTLRHRVAYTGVNTLESYMHPRVLAFAVGALGLGIFLRGRSWPAVALAVLASIIHPTTGMWFCLWVGIAAFVADRTARLPLLLSAGVGGLFAAPWVARGPSLWGAASRMDEAWLSVLTVKDYLFPGMWPLWAWALTAAIPVLIGLVYRSRQKAGVASPRETGLLAGTLALVLVLVASLQFVAARVAIAVQLQVPRVLWLLELFATAYLMWWLVERGAGLRSDRARIRVRTFVVASLALLSVARGTYVTFVEHAGRPVVRLDLPASEWQDAMAWVRRTPADTHVLADPGHAWKYGSSVRVAGERDVFQEDAKDAAFALYSRATALRVLTRIGDLGRFSELTATRARALAATYDIDYLVAEQPFDLPIAYQNSRFRIYALKEPPAFQPR